MNIPSEAVIMELKHPSHSIVLGLDSRVDEVLQNLKTGKKAEGKCPFLQVGTNFITGEDLFVPLDIRARGEVYFDAQNIKLLHGESGKYENLVSAMQDQKYGKKHIFLVGTLTMYGLVQGLAEINGLGVLNDQGKILSHPQRYNQIDVYLDRDGSKIDRFMEFITVTRVCKDEAKAGNIAVNSYLTNGVDVRVIDLAKVSLDEDEQIEQSAFHS